MKKGCLLLAAFSTNAAAVKTRAEFDVPALSFLTSASIESIRSTRPINADKLAFESKISELILDLLERENVIIKIVINIWMILMI